MDQIDNHEIAQGFDRGIDYLPMKKKLVSKLKEIYSALDTLQLDKLVIRFKSKQRILVNKLIYLTIACIQLRNGSRISEACKAFTIFLLKGNINDKVTVKISKSEGLKYNRVTKKKCMSKARYRHMIYPKSWFDMDIITIVKNTDNYLPCISSTRLRKRVLDYLLLNFNKCNTHSLRYAFINYMLIKKKQPMNVVAKFVGHTGVQQLVTYTQNKQVDELFDMDM